MIFRMRRACKLTYSRPARHFFGILSASFSPYSIVYLNVSHLNKVRFHSPIREKTGAKPARIFRNLIKQKKRRSVLVKMTSHLDENDLSFTSKRPVIFLRQRPYGPKMSYFFYKSFVFVRFYYHFGPQEHPRLII